MSLSQKHSGKVLVPWFNTQEWRAVNDLVYTGDKQNWPKALEILKIWKLRTPLLSAGVEGTLILLQALLVDTNQLSTFEITHIFSTSLVRFLNLCAANSDRQGSFYKTAKKHGLPKWLISVRHDIAHSHHVPSQSVLEISLKFCLEWLKERYWDIQEECMLDLTANELDQALLEAALYVHIHLTKSESISEISTELVEYYSRLTEDQSKNQFTQESMLELADNVLKKVIKTTPKDAANKICTMLLDSHLILTTDLELDASGNKKIPQSFLNAWNSLLDLMHETVILPNFVHTLFYFIYDEEHDASYCETAALWIQEIFQALIRQRNDSEDPEGLHFSYINDSMKDKSFITEVLEKPTQFTPIFLKEMLEYNNAPAQFIEDSCKLVSALYTSICRNNGGIFTTENLNLPLRDSSDKKSNIVNPVQSSSQWVPVTDTSPYINLPLGILPHQCRNINPLLDI